MARAANVCPRCGAPVTPYAAGCGVCGADLERRRRGRQFGLAALRRAAPTAGVTGSLFQNLVLIVLMLAVALFAPIFGLLVAGLVAFDRNRRGERTMRNLAIAAGALALIAFFFPVLPVGQLGAL
jgi:hypothetical protein